MAETAIDKPMIVNWALAELGQPPRFSIDDQTSLGRNVAIFWPRCLARCLGLHDWSFTRRTVCLTLQSGQPINGWPYAFSLPGNRIGPPRRFTSDPQCRILIRDFDIEGDTLFCCEKTAFARYKAAVDPEYWPPDFLSAFATALACYLAIPETQDPDLAADMEVRAFGSPSQGGAGGLFGRLIAQDLAGAPVGEPLLATDPLTAGRASGPWYGRF